MQLKIINIVSEADSTIVITWSTEKMHMKCKNKLFWNCRNIWHEKTFFRFNANSKSRVYVHILEYSENPWNFLSFAYMQKYLFSKHTKEHELHLFLFLFKIFKIFKIFILLE